MQSAQPTKKSAVHLQHELHDMQGFPVKGMQLLMHDVNLKSVINGYMCNLYEFKRSYFNQ